MRAENKGDRRGRGGNKQAEGEEARKNAVF
jgi:hypothetical protein